MDATRAVRATAGGTTLAVHVQPGARAARFPAGFDAWRGAVEARVRSAPEDGAANAELAVLVAAYFGVAPSAVRVATGHTSRRKVLHIVGLPPRTVLARLAREENA